MAYKKITQYTRNLYNKGYTIQVLMHIGVHNIGTYYILYEYFTLLLLKLLFGGVLHTILVLSQIEFIVLV